jgi:hypothetical protein
MTLITFVALYEPSGGYFAPVRDFVVADGIAPTMAAWISARQDPLELGVDIFQVRLAVLVALLAKCGPLRD